jgi:hypothetical protein
MDNREAERRDEPEGRWAVDRGGRTPMQLSQNFVERRSSP